MSICSQVFHFISIFLVFENLRTHGGISIHPVSFALLKKVAPWWHIPCLIQWNCIMPCLLMTDGSSCCLSSMVLLRVQKWCNFSLKVFTQPQGLLVILWFMPAFPNLLAYKPLFLGFFFPSKQPILTNLVKYNCVAKSSAKWSDKNTKWQFWVTQL